MDELNLAEQQTYSSDGIEQHLQVNHVAPALLTLLLLPSLLRAPLSRVINVNSVVPIHIFILTLPISDLIAPIILILILALYHTYIYKFELEV